MHISRAMSTSNWSTKMRYIHSKTYQMHRSAVAQHGKHNHHAFKVWWYKTMAASFYAKMIKKSHDLGLVLKWSKFYHPPTTSVVNKQNFSLVTFHNKKKETANKTATYIVFVLAFFHHLIFAPFLSIHLQLSKRCTSIKWPRNRTMTRKLCHLNRMDTSRLQQLLCQRPAKWNQVQWKSDHCICNRNKRIAKCNATNVHDAAKIIHNVKICDDIIGWNVGKSRNIRALCAIYDLNVIIKWVVICWRGMASKMPTIKCFCRMVMLLNFDSNRRRREKNRQTTKECFFVSHKKKWLCYKVST